MRRRRDGRAGARCTPEPRRLGELADLFRAVGGPTRLRLATALATDGAEELCVCDLAALVSVSQSAVSHSLRTLRELRVVRPRKVGRVAYYRLTIGSMTPTWCGW